MIKAYMVNGTDRYVIDFQVQSDRTIKMHCTEHPYDPYGKSVLYNHLYPDGHICVAAGHEPRTHGPRGRHCRRLDGRLLGLHPHGRLPDGSESLQRLTSNVSPAADDRSRRQASDGSTTGT